jgi:hypothetical protein
VLFSAPPPSHHRCRRRPVPAAVLQAHLARCVQSHGTQPGDPAKPHAFPKTHAPNNQTTYQAVGVKAEVVTNETR